MKASHSIDLKIREKLEGDREYRKRFFWAQAAAEIASQLIKLRKKRNLNQGEVAALIGTKQPAISRAEQADYNNWNLRTLRSISEALDARIRVVIEPAEDVLAEYDGPPHIEPSPGSADDGDVLADSQLRTSTPPRVRTPSWGSIALP
jgi:transcriptional regulator with XRE-family HTH domain